MRKIPGFETCLELIKGLMFIKSLIRIPNFIFTLKVCRQDEFLHISADQLMCLVKSDELNVRCEEKVRML